MTSSSSSSPFPSLLSLSPPPSPTFSTTEKELLTQASDLLTPLLTHSHPSVRATVTALNVFAGNDTRVLRNGHRTVRARSCSPPPLRVPSSSSTLSSSIDSMITLIQALPDQTLHSHAAQRALLQFRTDLNGSSESAHSHGQSDECEDNREEQEESEQDVEPLASVEEESSQPEDEEESEVVVDTNEREVHEEEETQPPVVEEEEVEKSVTVEDEVEEEDDSWVPVKESNKKQRVDVDTGMSQGARVEVLAAAVCMKSASPTDVFPLTQDTPDKDKFHYHRPPLSPVYDEECSGSSSSSNVKHVPEPEQEDEEGDEEEDKQYKKKEKKKSRKRKYRTRIIDADGNEIEPEEEEEEKEVEEPKRTKSIEKPVVVVEEKGKRIRECILTDEEIVERLKHSFSHPLPKLDINLARVVKRVITKPDEPIPVDVSVEKELDSLEDYLSNTNGIENICRYSQGQILDHMKRVFKLKSKGSDGFTESLKGKVRIKAAAIYKVIAFYKQMSKILEENDNMEHMSGILCAEMTYTMWTDGKLVHDSNRKRILKLIETAKGVLEG